MTLDNLPALKRIPRLKLLPSIHRSDLHAHIPLIRILRSQIRHRFRLLFTRIPHDRVFEVVADDVEARFAV